MTEKGKDRGNYYVIGWLDRCSTDEKIQANHQDACADVMIVAGLISRETHSLQQVSHALKELKEIMYTHSCNEDESHENDLIQSLQIVAEYRYEESESESESQVKRDEHSTKTYLPLIVPTKDGLNFKNDTDSSSTIHTLNSVILFQPCSIQSLDYYRHEFEPSQSSTGGEVTDNERRKSGTFHRLLTRMSETETLMQHLCHILSMHANDEDSRERIEMYTDVNTEPSSQSHPLLKKIDILDKVEEEASRLLSKSSGKNTSTLLQLHQMINAEKFPTQSPLISLLLQLRSCRTTTYAPQLSTNSIGYIPREIKAQLKLQQVRLISTLFIDSMLGVSCGLYLLHNQIKVVSYTSKFWTIVHQRFLYESIGWLETFPVGFKLNVPLTQVMGLIIRWFTETYENKFLGYMFSWTTISVNNFEYNWIVGMMGTLSLIMGFRTFLAAMYDLICLATFHIQCIAKLFQVTFGTQLSLFSSLWKLFRGKKKNILRQRSDTLEYDFMQLFLGMILFTTCLFLFTTVLVYHTFFAMIYLTVRVLRGGLWYIYCLMTYFSFGDIILSALRPGMFVKQVSFRQLAAGDDTSMIFFSTADSVTADDESKKWDHYKTSYSSSMTVHVLQTSRSTPRSIALDSLKEVLKSAISH